MWWIIVGIVIIVTVIGYFVFGRSTAQATSHDVADLQGPALSADHDQTPAEPGSEDQAVVGDGVIGPGPGTEPLES